MPEAKKTMLQARLLKRLRHLGMKSFDEYSEYLFSPKGMEEELSSMINVVTTNKTDFYREPKHFDHLVDMVLPELIKSYGFTKIYRFWSAGCSTGEEPYTLAIILSEFARRYPGFNFTVLGSDISTHVLDTACLGIYETEKVEPIPDALKKRYLLRSKSKSRGLVRIAPELRAKVQFRRVNFMDDQFHIPKGMDIVFCRNVLIYFDKPIQEMVLTRIVHYMMQGGFLFIGHSETLSGLKLPLVPVIPTIYKKL